MEEIRHKHERTLRFLSSRASSSLKELLETKHIYQSVQVDLDGIDAPLERDHHSTCINRGSNFDRRPLQEEIDEMAIYCWEVSIYGRGVEEFCKDRPPQVYPPLPRFRTYCNRCKSNEAHKLISTSTTFNLENEDQDVLGAFDGKCEVFQLVSLCQRCSTDGQYPLAFLIKRKGFKLTLVGRSEFDEISIDAAIPVEEKDYFSKAIVCVNGGMTLGGILYLRTFLEQYLKRVTKQPNQNLGEELCRDYKKYLQDEFPPSMADLNPVYRLLSGKLHNAEADGDAFEDAKEKLTTHFRMLQMMPLKDQP